MLTDSRRKKIPDSEPRTYAIAISAPNVRLSPFQNGAFTLMAVEQSQEKANRKFIAAQQFLGGEGQIVVYSWPKVDITQLTADAKFNLKRFPDYKDVRTTSAGIRDVFWHKVFKTVDPTYAKRGTSKQPDPVLSPVLIGMTIAVIMLAVPIGMVAGQAWSHFGPLLAAEEPS